MFGLDECEPGELVYIMENGTAPARGVLPWKVIEDVGKHGRPDLRWLRSMYNPPGLVAAKTLNPFQMTDGTWAIRNTEWGRLSRLGGGGMPHTRVSFLPVEMVTGNRKDYRLAWGMAMGEEF